MNGKKKFAAKIGKGMTRRERWHEHIKARLAEIEGVEGYIPAAWLEEVEGRPMAEVITARLAVEHGIGATDLTPEQKVNRLYDESYDGESTRRRNNYEKDCVYFAVSDSMLAVGGIVPSEVLHDFVRLFYRAGDRGLNAAIRRAVRDAVKLERDTGAND